MRSFVTCAVLASVASIAAAQVAHPLFEYPDTVPLEKRQEPGTPRYQCHEDCGLLISLGRTEGYCDSAEFNERYGRCMSCANTEGIWMYYRASVTAAAAECGLDAVPSPSGGGAAPATTTAAPAPATTTAAPAPPVSTTATTSAAAVTEPAVSDTSAAAPPAGASSSSAAAAASSSSSAAGVPATTLSTQATGAAATTGAATGTSTASRVHSIGTSVVIPSGTPTPTVVFAGAGKNAAAVGLGLVGMVLAAF
ncbi:hypothetical protein CH63R_07614 [Colletotrichum higginsianum IMI 349063]|uniref:Dynactin arp1 p25 subunit n=2 Tax=Colletotrichum higginsianum TaxID=80884 RepID=A0A1B7Y9W8_COLHI|nr:hypothetical protein CH63R_07614 [Colletotrichum higginsianum IMI 349063]OBR08849.1 hypothetical protein CH63R_07614 [Colletotrichum higginsianum IMI 349063]TIC95297.1 hypothetical protein CH35J_008501 [Colletotrichum higginsianum]